MKENIHKNEKLKKMKTKTKPEKGEKSNTAVS